MNSTLTREEKQKIAEIILKKQEESGMPQNIYAHGVGVYPRIITYLKSIDKYDYLISFKMWITLKKISENNLTVVSMSPMTNRTRFIHKQLLIPEEDFPRFVEILNAWGEEQWDLVNVEYELHRIICVFKKKVII